EYAGDVADPPDAPEDDQAGEYHKEDPCNPAGYKEAVVHDIGDRIGLDTVADAERCECSEEGEQPRQPFELPSDALFYVVHRAAGILAVLVFDPVDLGEQGFRVFCGHAEQTDEPHPEEGARAAKCDRCRNTSPMSVADPSVKGSHEWLETADIAFGTRVFLVFGECQSERRPYCSELQTLPLKW